MPQNKSRMDVLLLIDRLEDMVRDGASARLGAQVRLDRGAAFALVDEMRRQIPEEIRDARFICGAREEMLGEARREAERIVEAARAERARLLGPEEITPKAEQRAERILETARARARQIRLGAEGYADEILEGLETGFVKIRAAGRTQG